jgi:hypothetical protein
VTGQQLMTGRQPGEVPTRLFTRQVINARSASARMRAAVAPLSHKNFTITAETIAERPCATGSSHSADIGHSAYAHPAPRIADLHPAIPVQLPCSRRVKHAPYIDIAWPRLQLPVIDQ